MKRRRTVFEQPVNVDLPVDLVKLVDEFCDRTGMKKKQCIELSLRRFLAVETKR